jgi:hypothetical protein
MRSTSFERRTIMKEGDSNYNWWSARKKEKVFFLSVCFRAFIVCTLLSLENRFVRFWPLPGGLHSLGEFSPNEWLFTWGSFSKLKEVARTFWATSFQSRDYELIFHSKALWSLPKLGALAWNYTIWQFWIRVTRLDFFRRFGACLLMVVLWQLQK